MNNGAGLKLAGLAAALLAALTLPAMANNPPPGKIMSDIFTGLFSDLGLLGLGSLAIAAIAAVLMGLRENGVLSDRWRFGRECDQDD